jgi:hypothetical protein
MFGNKSDIKAFKLEKGTRVRCTSNLPGYNGKIGIIEQELSDGSFRVRFDNVVITLGKEELVVAGNDDKGLLQIKDEDFDDTVLEKEMVKEIENIAKKVKVALKIYGNEAFNE